MSDLLPLCRPRVFHAAVRAIGRAFTSTWLF